MQFENFEREVSCSSHFILIDLFPALSLYEVDGQSKSITINIRQILDPWLDTSQ